MQSTTYKLYTGSQDIDSRLKFVLDYINTHPLSSIRLVPTVEESKSQVLYSLINTKEDHTWIFRQHLFFKQTPQPKTFYANKYIFQQTEYYSVESEKKTEHIINTNEIPFDIFETIFFHISRYEEWFLLEDSDENNHFLIRHKLQRTPIVDQLIILLNAILGQPQRTRQSKIVLTHDIDNLLKFRSRTQIFRKIGGHLLRRRRLSDIPRLVRDYYRSSWLGKDDPYDNLEWLLSRPAMGDKYLFLIVGGNHPLDPPVLTDEQLHYLVEAGRKNGYEIGLHPSYLSHTNASILRNEYERLEGITRKPLINSRQHFLHIDIKITPNLLIDLGIQHDFTLGYSRHVGFRCGTGFPYSLYSFHTEKALDLICHPLAFMDSSCFHEAKSDGELFQSIYHDFFTQNKSNGNLVVNFHNQFFDTASYYDIPLAKMYEQLLRDFAGP